MESFKIVLLAVAAAVAYGIAHDQITVRVCIEYFTIGHPRLPVAVPPTILALIWGVAATWWVGLALGLLLAWAARRGPGPALAMRDLLRPVAGLLALCGALALLAGVAGHRLACAGLFHLVEPLAGRVPRDRHAVFLADLAAHWVSYLSAGVGGVVLALRVRARRRRAAATHA